MLSNSVGSSCSREGNPAVFVNVFPVVVISPLRTSTLLIEVLYPRLGERSHKATPAPPDKETSILPRIGKASSVFCYLY